MIMQCIILVDIAAYTQLPQIFLRSRGFTCTPTYLQSYNLIKILTSGIAGNYMILLLSPDSNLNILTIRILNSYVVSDLAGILPTYTDVAMYVLTTITFGQDIGVASSCR